MALRIRRGSDADRQLINPAQGELIYTTDTKKLYIGDGSTSGATAHGVLVGPADSAQTDLLNDTSPQLGGNLDLNGFNITGNGNIQIDGTIEATGNINLGNGAEDNVIVGGQIASSLIPDAPKTYSLGAGNIQWEALHVGDVFASGTVEANNLVVTDYIWKGDTSTLLYNGDNDTLSVTTIEGNLVGNVYDEESGVILDVVNRNLTIDDITADSINTAIINSNDDIVMNTPVVSVVGPNGDGQLNVTNTDPFAATLELDTFTDNVDGFGGFVAMGRGRGSVGNRQLLQGGDNIYNLIFLGHRSGGSDIGASISTFARGVVSDGICPTEVQFLTTDEAGSLENRLSIHPDGRLEILFNYNTSTVDIANGTTIDLTKTTHYFTTDSAWGANLPGGDHNGQVIMFVAKDVSAGNMVINVGDAGWTPGAGTITFANTGEGCTLQWIQDNWFCVGNNGALFA